MRVKYIIISFIMSFFLLVNSTYGKSTKKTFKDKSKNPSQSKKFWDKLDLTTEMNTRILDSEFVKARILGFHIGLDYEYDLSEDMKFFLVSKAILETGSNEVIGTFAEYEPNESISLDSGGIIYSPLSSSLELSLGALNQRSLNSPLLIGSHPFAGAQEKLSFYNFYIRLQQTIPSNNNLSKRIGAVETGTPYFSSESFGGEFGTKHRFQFEVSHFSFRDLSPSIAEKSQVFGNSTEGTGISTKFLYGFDGVNLQLKTSFVFSGFELEFGGHYLYNDKAPDDRNKGTLVFSSFKTGSIGLILENFSNAVSYTHLRAHETDSYLVCRLLLEKR